MLAAPDRLPPWKPGRLVSLWDMITGQLAEVVHARTVLLGEAQRLDLIRVGKPGHESLSLEHINTLKRSAAYVESVLNKWTTPSSDERLGRLNAALKGHFTYEQIGFCVRALQEAVEDDLKYICYYAYPRHKSLILARLEGDWAATLTAFPGTRSEIQDGVDCFATGHNTAAVFHMMRVAEHGLRAIGKERRVRLPKTKPIEWAQWGEIIAGLAKEIEAIRNWKAGARKDAAYAYYSAVRSHMTAFQHEYRDDTMHARKRYDEAQSDIVIRRVRDFMNGVSAKLGESAKRIRWR